MRKRAERRRVMMPDRPQDILILRLRIPPQERHARLRVIHPRGMRAQDELADIMQQRRPLHSYTKVLHSLIPFIISNTYILQN